MAIRGDFVEAMGYLVDVEEAAGALYRVYARCHAEHARFWDGLAHEEDAHALWVRNLLEKMQQGAVTFKDDRFSPETYRTFRDYLRQRVREAEQGCVTLIEGLAIAVDLESAFVERGFFEIFDGDAEPIRNILQRLSTSSEEHLRRVRAYLTEQRMTGRK